MKSGMFLHRLSHRFCNVRAKSYIANGLGNHRVDFARDPISQAGLPQGLVQKTGDRRFQRSGIRLRKLQSDPGGCGGAEGGGWGGITDEQFWGVEGREGIEREALVEEEANGERADAGIGEGGREWGWTGVGEDDGGDGEVLGGEVAGQAGSDAGAEEEDVVFGDGARVAEVAESGVCVFGHPGLGGVDGGALAVAAVVEGKEIQAKGVEDGDVLGVLWAAGEGVVASAEVEDGVAGVAGGSGGGEVGSGELRKAGLGGVEVDLIGGELGQDVEGLGVPVGMEHELPLALVEEEAEGDVTADQGSEDGETDGFEEPEGVDDLDEILAG
jgi:hypothetical protein